MKNIGVRSHQVRGDRIFLIGDLNYNNIYFEFLFPFCTSMLCMHDAIQDNKYPLALKHKLQN